MQSIIKKRVFWGIFLAILVFGVFLYVYSTRNKKASPEFVTARKGTVIQEVTVTGQVKPTESVDLGFEKSGKVFRTFAKVGDKVLLGQLLASLESGELLALLSQAQANLAAEDARLAELQKGARAEDIQISQTKVASAQRSLADAQSNLTAVQNKADADLESTENAALTAALKAVNIGKTALLTLTDIQYTYFQGTDLDGIAVAEAKAISVEKLLGARDAGRWTTSFLSILKGGAFGAVENAIVHTPSSVEAVIFEAIEGLSRVKQALETVPVSTRLTTLDKTNLAAEKNNISSEIITVSGKEQAIAMQKASNASSITSAQASLDSAQNARFSAEDELRLKLAGTSPEQILVQAARVKSAQAQVQNYQAQLAKTVIVSPIAGVVTRQDAKAGAIVSPNVTLVSVNSENTLEIEANVAEADIAKVKIDDLSAVTLDAYSSNDVFAAKVVRIDPAATIIEGVATYKIILDFITTVAGLKSGMTANLDIVTSKKEDVVFISQRALLNVDGKQTVRVLSGKIIKAVEVQSGLRGSDGNTEIIRGINEGDKVIIGEK